MAIYTKSGGEIKSVTPYLKRNGEVITPSSVWVKTGGEVHKVWPVEDGPFEIYDQATLQEFRDRVNAGEYDLDAVVTADFSLSGDFGDPIGGQAKKTAYTGTFDGRSHTITGLTVESEEKYVGLFGYVNGGAIKSVKLAEASLTATSRASRTGGIVGFNDGTVENCTYDGTASGMAFLGGIVGENYDTVENCTNNGELNSGSATTGIGGIVGNNWGPITNCNNLGTLTGKGDSCTAGGIVADNYRAVTGCNNYGTVTAEKYAGGIVAEDFNGSITNCNNSGAVTATGSNGYAGGIAASLGAGSTVTDCKNTGNVSGTNIVELSAGEDEATSAAGGIVGYASEGATITGCVNEGEVSGAAHVGDIIGMEGPAKEEDVPEEAATTESEEE